MIPMWMKLRFPSKEKRPVILYVPLFLVWILLLVLFVLILPIWLIASAIACALGFGRTGLALIPLIVSTLWHLKGLEVDVGSRDRMITMKWL
jgi:hypothetical protein